MVSRARRPETIEPHTHAGRAGPVAFAFAYPMLPNRSPPMGTARRGGRRDAPLLRAGEEEEVLGTSMGQIGETAWMSTAMKMEAPGVCSDHVP